MAEIVTFETPDGRKVCVRRSALPYLSAAWRNHEPVLPSHAGQVCARLDSNYQVPSTKDADDGNAGIIVEGLKEEGSLTESHSALLPASSQSPH